MLIFCSPISGLKGSTEGTGVGRTTKQLRTHMTRSQEAWLMLVSCRALTAP